MVRTIVYVTGVRAVRHSHDAGQGKKERGYSGRLENEKARHVR
jgi:hypothetical protein